MLSRFLFQEIFQLPLLAFQLATVYKLPFAAFIFGLRGRLSAELAAPEFHQRLSLLSRTDPKKLIGEVLALVDKIYYKRIIAANLMSLVSFILDLLTFLQILLIVATAYKLKGLAKSIREQDVSIYYYTGLFSELGQKQEGNQEP